MRPSNLKQRKDQKKNTKSKNKLIIQDEPNSKFKNEIFQKLCERNNASKERFNTIDNTSMKNYQSPRSNSNYKDKRNKNSQFKLKNPNNFDNNPPNTTKSKKIYRAPYNPSKFKYYPNLIGGVLNQVNYYNTNNNNNYNEYVRYKPVDYFFNEQSSIYPKKEIENNNNSPNISFNSENQNEKKGNGNKKNNIRKIKIEEEENNDNIYNTNYNFENDMKANADSSKSKKNDIIEKNVKSISPIISTISSNDLGMKKDNNDTIGQYINNNTDKSDYMNENENNINKGGMDKNNINDDNVNLRNKKIVKHLTPSQFKVEKPEKEEEIKVKEENKEKIDKLIIENINNFVIYNINKYFNNLEQMPTNIFSIYNNKENVYDNLEEVKYDDINYIGNNNINNEINDEKLIFKNDNEILNYIKDKIKEEKDNEYNNQNKENHNNFILSRKYHDKILYEIGLVNDINYINSILEKENVEIENEQVIFIPKKELEKLKNNNKQENITTNSNDEVEKLKKENEKLKKKIDLINKNYEEMNSNLINDYNKLMEENEKLDDKNKEIENEINNKQNIINEYENKIKEYDKIIEINNTLQIEREKFVKYINELQEYDEKVILEYQKVKQQLEIEKEKNNLANNNNIKKYFTNEELEIKTNELFNIINQNQENIDDNEKENEYENDNQPFISQNNIYENNIEENKNNVEQIPETVKKEEEIIEQKVQKDVKLDKHKEKKDTNKIINNNENIEEKKNKQKYKVSFGADKYDIKNRKDIKKRDESLSRAMQRINNKRRMDKISEEKNKFRKSKKVEGMAGNLEDKLKNNEGKFYVDLEYEKNKSDEDNYNY